MSSELYSTNPTIVGGGLIVATACIVGGAAAPDVEYSVWPYVTVGFGLLFFGMALSITGSVGLSGMLRICSTVGALAWEPARSMPKLTPKLRTKVRSKNGSSSIAPISCRRTISTIHHLEI